jgi:hypothetical protein
MCTNNSLPKLTMTEINTLKPGPYPTPIKNADEDICQNNDHIRREGARIKQIAVKFGVPTNEHGLVTDSVLEILINNRKEE